MGAINDLEVGERPCCASFEGLRLTVAELDDLHHRHVGNGLTLRMSKPFLVRPRNGAGEATLCNHVFKFKRIPFGNRMADRVAIISTTQEA